jgi:hypothetical protein
MSESRVTAAQVIEMIEEREAGRAPHAPEPDASARLSHPVAHVPGTRPCRR